MSYRTATLKPSEIYCSRKAQGEERGKTKCKKKKKEGGKEEGEEEKDETEQEWERDREERRIYYIPWKFLQTRDTNNTHKSASEKG